MGRLRYSVRAGGPILARSYLNIKIIGRDPEDWIPKGFKRTYGKRVDWINQGKRAHGKKVSC